VTNGADVCLLSSSRTAQHSALSSAASYAFGSRANRSAAFYSHAPEVQIVSQTAQSWDMSEFVGAAAALCATLGLAAGASQAVAEYRPVHQDGSSTTGNAHQDPRHSHASHNHNSTRNVSGTSNTQRVLPVVHVPTTIAEDPHSSSASNMNMNSLVHPAHSSSAGKTLTPIRRRNARMIRRDAVAAAEEALMAKPMLPFSMPERQLVEKNTAAVESTPFAATATVAVPASTSTAAAHVKPAAEVSQKST
jgi:hypothetical protein